jgi:hypothetical protein
MTLSLAQEGVVVALATCVWTAVLFALTRRFSSYLIERKYAYVLPVFCFVWTVLFVISISVLIYVYRDKDAAFVSAFSSRWIGAGWSPELLFMGIRIDTWYAYMFIINYQITRCILGSLLANAFQPYVNMLQGKILSQALTQEEKITIVLARFCVDTFGFVSSLTDLILYIAQLDISLISFGVSALTNGIGTWIVLCDDKKAKADTQVLYEETRTEPLFLTTREAQVGARLRL